MKIIFYSLSLILALSACAQKKVNNNATGNQSDTQVTEKAVTDLSKLSKATFASGCFWCVEGVFESVKGVQEAVSGYSGGTEDNPTYEQVGSGATGHAEAVEVYYDSTQISYSTLLTVFFDSQNPTQVNGQGPDRGKQYRSIIFYRNEAEKAAATSYIAQLNASGKYDAPIAAEVVPLVKFWEAEGYHQSYVKANPNQPYVRGESIPRIQEFQAKHPELIKDGEKY